MEKSENASVDAFTARRVQLCTGRYDDRSKDWGMRLGERGREIGNNGKNGDNAESEGMLGDHWRNWWKLGVE